MSEEICDGVRILCERMENNPEDFIKSEFNPSTMEQTLGKFYYEGRNIEGLAKGHPDAIEGYWHLTQAERDALVQSYKNMMRNEFTRRVVEKLLDAPAPEQEIRFTTQGRNVGKSILTTAQIQNESLRLLNKSFEDAYNHSADALKYKASGRYATGFGGEPLINPWK